MSSAARQIELLGSIQELLSASRYTTTYKFALLHALCDLALEMAPDQRELPLERVAERTIELYWQQVIPFNELMLKQSTGKPAKAVSLISAWQCAKGEAMHRAPSGQRMLDYSKAMLAVLQKDVLGRLQPKPKPGHAPLLYELPVGREHLVLQPDVADTLRLFHGMLTDMIQTRWTAWIEQQNPAVRGSDALRSHLFVVDRESLRGVVEPMLELQEGRCFYSGDRITKSAEVDHFLPWSRTHNNSVGNLVLATKAANLKKLDSLAPQAVLEKWRRRNREHEGRLAVVASDTGLPWEPAALEHLAAWLYRRAG